MNKKRLFFCCLLLLILNFSRSAIPVQSQDAPVSSTLQSRKQELSEQIAERERLLPTGDALALVRVRNRITELQLLLCDLDAAVVESQASLDLARQFAGTSNATLLADTLTLSADANLRHGQNETALALLEEARNLSGQLAYRRGEAQARTLAGNAYYAVNKTPEAADQYNQALQIWREVNDQRGEAQVLTAQGEVYILNDQPAEASAALQNAETIWRSLNDQAGLVNTLLDRGLLANRLGQWQSSLSWLYEANAVLTDKDAEPFLAGKIATTFGEIYEAYGQLDIALSYFREALTRYRDGAHDKAATIDLSRQVGRVQARLHNFNDARDQIQQGLTLALETKNDLLIGLCHEDFGRLWLEAQNYEAARTELLTAIDYYGKSSAKRPLARAQTYLGQTQQMLGNLPLAEAAYKNALRLFKENDLTDYTNEAALSFGLGKLALQQKDLKAAEEYLKRSIELTQQLRENAWSKELRSSFVASVYDRYQSYVELLMTQNAMKPDPARVARAFEASESGRARALIDSLHNLNELRQPTDPALVLEEAALQKKEQELIDKQASLASQGGSDDEKARVNQELTEVHSRYETLQARINNNARFNYLLRPTPLGYEEIRAELTDAGTSLLSYSLGAQKSFAWLIDKDGLHSFELSNKQTIEDASNRLLNLLTTPATEQAERDRLQSSIDEVSRLVLQPVADKLPTARLIVVADGALQYVPFQILKTSTGNGEPLISRVEIVEAPSASALALVKRQRSASPPTGKLLVGFGDAIFSNDYTPAGSTAATFTTVASNETAQTRSPSISKLSRLPRLFNARRELLAISDLAGSDSSFYTEYNATRENLLNLDLSQYRILHVVTHGVLDAQQPDLSGLVLSLVDANKHPITGFVSLADIYKLRAPQLVVLSACYTALGKKQDGEGLIGVTRGFMYAGASGVVASLWQVDDRATAELMKYFYANMLQHGMGPAAALRDAQNKIRSQPKWSSPYYWAGFTFQGDYGLSIHGVPKSTIGTYQYLLAGGPVLIVLVAGIYWWYLRRRTRTTT
jgi:CHAT domain-containing protein